MNPLFPQFPRVAFEPHPFLRSGHAQTCFTTVYLGRRLPYRARQHVIPTTHDDRLVLHDDQPEGWRPGDPMVLLIHGLGGCHRSPYLVRMAAKMNLRGLRTMRMDMRGCGVGDRLAKQPGHAGRSEDVAAAVAFMRATCPQSPLVAAGFSLGGNLLLKYVAESDLTAEGSGLQRALSVSAPIDLAHCARRMQHRSRLIYSRWFIRLLVRQLGRRRRLHPELDEVDLTRLPRTLYEFDDRVTAPLSGFASAAEYYARCSSATGLGQIRTPTLLLTAADDPLIPAEMYDGVPDNPYLAVHITQYGGHVAYFGRRGGDPDWHWLDWRVVEFAEEATAAAAPPPRIIQPVG